ncbi:hypothetical protein MKW92_043378 [Papaver armeniacum]|nr:hypothetical protein MKW92_043378 [Papaver armeniacum]
MNSCLSEDKKGKNKLPEARKKLPKGYLYKDEPRGSILFSTNRPPVPFDIFTRSIEPSANGDELRMTDGKSYNYNGNDIPPEALKKLLTYTKLSSEPNEAGVDSGRISGMVFISERDNLELLHIAILFKDVNKNNPPKVQIYSLADVFRKTRFAGVRMEDSGCVSGDDLIYVSTKRPATERCQPWTAVYKTNLKSGLTHRLTPRGQADLNPSVSKSGKKIAVATFEGKGGWDGAIEDLKTDIYVMNVEEPFHRRLVIKNGGWPTWGSDNVIFFHRKDNKTLSQDTTGEIDYWGVYRAEINSDNNIDAFTPAAIDATRVAVATIRQKLESAGIRNMQAQYRHIEIFHSTGEQLMQITHGTRLKVDHFNPFVIGGGKRIGYHCCTSDRLDDEEEINRQLRTIPSPDPCISLYGVGGGFPCISNYGTKVAVVDNNFKIWVPGHKGTYEAIERTQNSIFLPVWNQRHETLYVCKGPPFSADGTVDIYAIRYDYGKKQPDKLLTNGFNNAFPSSNPEGTRIVYRSTRDGYKNLYIMDADIGVYNESQLVRLTNGDWTDTQCQWSPRGNWIVFSSNRGKPRDTPEKNHGLDRGFFAIYLVDPEHSDVIVRVIASGNDLGGHVNHPFFCPDGLSVVVSSDFAGVSVDPISLPSFLHAARAYGDIFTVDIDPDDIQKNKNVKMFNRITHSRYENWAYTWNLFGMEGFKMPPVPFPYRGGERKLADDWRSRCSKRM